MGRAKITVDEEALAEIDRLVREGTFPNRGYVGGPDTEGEI